MSEAIREYYGDGAVTHKTAQEIGPIIDDLAEAKGGEVTTLDLLKAAQDEASPLHKHITWNERHAANQWRLNECRQLLNGVRVRVLNSEGVVVQDGPVVMCVRSAARPAAEEFDGDDYRLSPYVQTVKVKTNKDASDRVLEDAIMQVVAFRKRFLDLQATLQVKFRTTKKVAAALDQFADEASAKKAA